MRKPRSSIRSIIFLGVLLGLGPAGHARVKTPMGEVKPTKGPFAGKVCRYGDVAGLHIKVAEFTIAELEDFISGKRPPKGMAIELLDVLETRLTDYGGQLSKEGYDRYGELVKAALEEGEHSEYNTLFSHRATSPIGIDIYSGKATKVYWIHWDPGAKAWVLFPAPGK